MEKHIVLGFHAVEALLSKRAGDVVRLCVEARRKNQRIAALFKLAKKAQVMVETLPRAELDKLAEYGRHQGVVAVRSSPETLNYQESDIVSLLGRVSEPPLLLLLDGVQDPHNLGACLRSADCFGIDVVIAPKDRAVGLTATVRKVASGAAETVPFIQVTNFARTLRLLKEQGIWLFGATDEAEQSLYEIDLKQSVGWVLGAEGRGLRRLTREHCDALVSIPMQGSVSSLNVSVATGVCLFETVRQRRR